MNPLLLVTLALVALTGTATVLVRDPPRQLVAAGMFGLALAIMFFAFGAPDVALSQIVVSAVALPVMALLTLVRFNRDDREDG
jgi:energy-converting hydrogenase B subunit D